MIFHRISKLFQPRIFVPPGKERNVEVLSTSQKLLFDLGFVRPSNTGTNVLLPLTVRVLKKLKRIIRTELNKIGAQEILLPLLTPLHLLQTTGRDSLPELFKLKDRHDKDYTLSPTNEESIVDLIASLKPSYKQFPISLYQISQKFRDEMKPKFGLMRSREFLMKDMYCFSTSSESSMKNYEAVNVSYRDIFDQLGVPFASVEGCSGDIGGSLSHEFHILSDIGEDKLIICKTCGHGENVTRVDDITKCIKCKSFDVEIKRGIEVGHSFLLDTTYTAPLNATISAADGTSQLLFMSCHGIGLTRLVAASVEVLSLQDQIRWPSPIVPFSVCIIPPKAGSKEERTKISAEDIYRDLSKVFPDDVVLDDRIDLTIGKRLTDAKRMGYPYVVIIGKSAIASEPTVEVVDVSTGANSLVTPSNLCDMLSRK